jgi:ribonucleoside-diphosphate reductase alpha chain
MITESMSQFAANIYKYKYAHPGEEWADTAKRVATTVMAAIGYGPEAPETVEIEGYIRNRQFMPGGRYLAATGRDVHQTQNCLLMIAEDSREGWAELLWKCAMALQTGAGIGVEYSKVRPKGSPIRRTGGVASGPLELMRMVNEVGRGIMQGGSRRSAIWAGLNWNHADINDFVHMKDWPAVVREAKAKDFNFPALMDMTNISVGLDELFFDAYNDSSHVLHDKARKLYADVIKQMFTTAEPGFSINLGDKAAEVTRNACTEVTSADDSDICNLGSINLSRVTSIEEMRRIVKAGTLFLMAGTVYSDLPYEKVGEVRKKNRRLGLGLMGIHEWLLQRGHKYGPNDELGTWMAEYAKSGEYAAAVADKHKLSVPVATRAIAPTGTISIVAETTSGIEPIFCAAYKRRYLVDGKDWKFQYVIDPAVRRLVEQGVDPDSIEDAYSLSYDFERRVSFQAWLQGYVDQAISSTINMPSWGTPANDAEMLPIYGDILMKYLPKLRGITVYPDGCRGGQPLVPVRYQEAVGKEGLVFEESEERCVGGVCGT